MFGKEYKETDERSVLTKKLADSVSALIFILVEISRHVMLVIAASSDCEHVCCRSGESFRNFPFSMVARE